MRLRKTHTLKGHCIPTGTPFTLWPSQCVYDAFCVRFGSGIRLLLQRSEVPPELFRKPKGKELL